MAFVYGFLTFSRFVYAVVWILGFPSGSVGKESACNAEYPGLIPGSGRSPGKGNGKPTPVLLPGEFHGQRNWAGYSLWVAQSQT